MPIPTNRITTSRSNAHTAKAASPPALSSAFESSILLEKAEQILRPTDQYAAWKALRRRNHPNLSTIAELVLKRDEISRNPTSQKSRNWQAFDKITNTIAEYGIHLPNAKQIQFSTTSSSRPLPDPAPPLPSLKRSGLSPLLIEDNVLILSAVSKEIGLKHDIVGYGDGEQTVLPLGEIARALDFNIQVQPEQGRATGWFIAEERTLFIDKESKRIEIDGQRYPWDESQIFVGEDDIYIEA